MTQNTRRSTTETWQAQAQENLEHSAQQEASILDLAQDSLCKALTACFAQ